MQPYLLAVAVLVACLSTVQSSYPSKYQQPSNPYAGVEGQVCEPPFGFLPNTCGESELIGEMSETAPRSKYGPNVCKITQIVRRQVLEYRYRSSCGWVYSYAYYSYIQQCSAECAPVGSCDEAPVQIDTVEQIRCCEGFLARSVFDEDYYNHAFTGVHREPLGCPVAYGPSLLSCLQNQGLDRFLELYRQVKRSCPLLKSALKLVGAEYTVFAPNNSAFDAIDTDSLSNEEVCQLLLNHVVRGKFDAANLLFTVEISSQAKMRLYANTVVYYALTDGQLQGVVKERFVNGVPVLLRDACDSESVTGSLHIISEVIMTPPQMTLARILESDPRLSTFTNALVSTGIQQWLMDSIPHTVFAPTNEAFNNSEYRPQLLDCILSTGGNPLIHLLRFHILGPVEYQSSLSLNRYWVTTTSNENLRVGTINGTVFLSEDLSAQIIDGDIQGQNGVIHVIDRVLPPPTLLFAIADNILGCLRLHQLNEFIALLNQTDYYDLLNMTEAEITVFAPTDLAFASVRDQLAMFSPERIIGTHIVNQTVKIEELQAHATFDNLAGSLLHGTVVIFYDYGYHYSYQQTKVQRFINGGQVTNKDACRTSSGTLHIINRVLIPSNRTIADILSSGPDFQLFTAALDTVGLLEFLNKTEISRTVFVVPDEAFAQQIPPPLLNCLTVYMRRPLNDLLLHHILPDTQYNSSIAVQTWLYTLLLQYVQVHSFQNGSIALGNDIVPITVTNIPARNGVLHVVDGFVFPNLFDFGKCQEFVPTPPPTEPPPPSPSPFPSPTPSAFGSGSPPLTG